MTLRNFIVGRFDRQPHIIQNFSIIFPINSESDFISIFRSTAVDIYIISRHSFRNFAPFFHIGIIILGDRVATLNFDSMNRFVVNIVSDLVSVDLEYSNIGDAANGNRGVVVKCNYIGSAFDSPALRELLRI